MARKFLTPIDLSKLEIQNVAAQNLASFPSSPVPGQFIYRSDLEKMYVYTGDGSLGTSGWVALDGSDIPDSTITSAKIADGTIVDGDVASDAGITYGKLDLGNSIVDNDIAYGASIAYGKLNLSNSIGNSDINASASIDYSKLNLYGSITDSDVASGANISVSKLNTSEFDSQVQTSRLDQMSAPTADVSLNSQKITDLADPVSDTDAATKRYVDGAVQGLSWKPAVRVSSNDNVNVNVPGSAIDGVSLNPGDRVLLLNQSDAAENGVWVWSDPGDPLVRAADASTGEQLLGAAVFVEEGTNADQAFTMISDGPITVGDDALNWTQFTGLGQVVAGQGLVKTGNQIDIGGSLGRIAVYSDYIDIDEDYAGQASINTLGSVGTGTWQADTIAVAYGGTGATSAADARSNLGATTKYSANIGGSTSIPVSHNLGTKDVVVTVRDNDTDAVVECDIVMTDINTVTVGFAVAPTAGAYRVTVIG